jgi:hypothetical protein
VTDDILAYKHLKAEGIISSLNKLEINNGYIQMECILAGLCVMIVMEM